MLGEESSRSDRRDERASAHSDARAEPNALELVVGKRVGGTDWVLEGTLGRGGMAVVLAVVKELAGIRGAMKVPHAELIAGRGASSRFLEEARLYTSLKHPHIVSVIDCGMLDNGLPFTVMERLRGRTLRDVMRGQHAGGRGLRAAIAHEVVCALCDALHRLHAHSVVHRDVKPENIFIHEVEGVAGRGTVKLLDLGLAGQAGLRRKVLTGTPRYMAPEQIRGEAATAQSDQYSVALVLYEMLTGRLPWSVDVANVEAMMEVHLKTAPMPLSQLCAWVPRAVNEAVLRALAKEPTKRLPSILDFGRAIGELESCSDSPQEESDVCITAPTAPTLASLAAYDSAASQPPSTGQLTAEAGRKSNGKQASDTTSSEEPSSNPTVRDVDSLLRGLERVERRDALASRRLRAEAATVPEPAIARGRIAQDFTTDRDMGPPPEAAEADAGGAPISMGHADVAGSDAVSSPAVNETEVAQSQDLRLPASVSSVPEHRRMPRRIAVAAVSLGFCVALLLALVSLGQRRAALVGTAARPTPVNAPARAFSSAPAEQKAPAAMVPVLSDPPIALPAVSRVDMPRKLEGASAARATPGPVKSVRTADHGSRPSAKPVATAPEMDDGREFFR
jgi:serine/threonine protein kinase